MKSGIFKLLIFLFIFSISFLGFTFAKNDTNGFPMVKIPIRSCVGEGELYLYQQDPFQEIKTSFVVSRDQVLIFARSDASLSAKVNNVNTPLIVMKEKTEDFHVKIYSLETSPGSIVNINGTSTTKARKVQGYLAQDAANPVFNLDTLEVIIDDGRINTLNLTPGVYSYVFFDKYSENRPGQGVDNRLLRVMVDGVSGNVIDESFTQPHPSPVEGAVVGNFSIEVSGVYNLSVETEDSIYWMIDGCVQFPLCGDGIVDESEDCDDGANNNDSDLCTDSCQFTICGDNTVQTPNGVGTNGPLNDGFEACDDGNTEDNDQCTPLCTLTFCGDEIIQEPNGLGQNEQCDDGNAIDGDGCSSECQLEICGDGIVDEGEQCDEGDDNGIMCNPDYEGMCSFCSSTCEFEIIDGGFCSDGNIDVGFEGCDYGSNNGIMCNPDYEGMCSFCSSTCEFEIIDGGFCSDGNIDVGFEGCDDGNNIDGDGCSAICKIEILDGPFCGDDILQIGLGEECDNGISNGITCDNSQEDCTFCSLSCKVTTLQGPEEENNGGRSRSSKRSEFIQVCDPNWVCSSWTSCNDSVKTRECLDSNQCEFSYNKPHETTQCDNGLILKSLIEKKDFTLLLVLLIITFILLIVMVSMIGKKSN